MLVVNFLKVTLYNLVRTKGSIPLSKVCSLTTLGMLINYSRKNSQPVFHNSLENVFIEQVLINQFKA